MERAAYLFILALAAALPRSTLQKYLSRRYSGETASDEERGGVGFEAGWAAHQLFDLGPRPLLTLGLSWLICKVGIMIE